MHRSEFKELHDKCDKMYNENAIDNAAKIIDSKVKFCKMPEVKVDLTDRANLALQAATPLSVINKAEIIESQLIKAARGGPWHDPGTWEGGIIPGENNIVDANGCIILLFGTVRAKELRNSGGLFVVIKEAFIFTDFMLFDKPEVECQGTDLAVACISAMEGVPLEVRSLNGGCWSARSVDGKTTMENCQLRSVMRRHSYLGPIDSKQGKKFFREYGLNNDMDKNKKEEK